MSELKVRKINFRFEEDVQFQWNPGNPACGNMVNIMSFIAPAFERYFIKSLRDALPMISDQELAEEVDLFCKQEGQHSRNHFAHLAMLDTKYPGLAQIKQEVIESYDALYESRDLKFHVAYMANLELLFAPIAEFLLRNLERLFGKSDQRIASFILWHLVEEFEHRSVAIRVYRHLYRDYFYRLKNWFVMLRHIYSEAGGIVRNGLSRYVPSSDNAISHEETGGVMKGTEGRLAFVLHCLDTAMPWHDPYSIKQPEWVSQWIEDEDAGEDMTMYYPRQPLSELLLSV